jgi:hypothetical protein
MRDHRTIAAAEIQNIERRRPSANHVDHWAIELLIALIFDPILMEPVARLFFIAREIVLGIQKAQIALAAMMIDFECVRIAIKLRARRIANPAIDFIHSYHRV